MLDKLHTVDTGESSHAELRPVSMRRISLTGGFWLSRMATILKTTIPSQYDFLESSGVIDNFRNAAAGRGEFAGLRFADTDAYKWLEAASYSLAYRREAALESRMDDLIALIAGAQDEDGYLDTYYSFGNRSRRWTELGTMHELYCAGHLMQAAIAHYRATGADSLLDVAVRCADNIDDRFGAGKNDGTGGHPEVEMALVELYRCTGAERYLKLASFFIDQRGRIELPGLPPEVIVNHTAFRNLKGMVGHAVRSLYLNCGAADVYMENGDSTLLESLERLWLNFTTRRMYVTGGAGARYEMEAFGDDYELPNRRAYAETCAAIAAFMWNWRMLLATGQSRYADIMELSLYNGMLSGLSLDGRSYFYMNPLADRGGYSRSEWLHCACCIPNLARTLASFPGCLFSTSQNGIWLHHYASCRAEITLGRDPWRIEETTAYPWEGDIDVSLSGDDARDFDLFIRIPQWASGASISVNGMDVQPDMENGYAKIRRRWDEKTDIRVHLNMLPQPVACHPHVLNNHGRFALKRGPIVYCLEQVDNHGFDVWDLAVAPDSNLQSEFRPEMLGGIATISGNGVAADHSEFGSALYRQPLSGGTAGGTKHFTAVPYFTWANRTPGPMITWIRSM